MLVIPVHTSQDLAGYLGLKRQKRSDLQKEIDELEALQKACSDSGLDSILVDREIGPEGTPREIYVTRDFSQADSVAVEEYTLLSPGNHNRTYYLNFFRLAPIDDHEIPIYCRTEEGEQGKIGVLWREFENLADGFKLTVFHNYDTPGLIKYLASLGTRQDLLDKARKEIEQLHQKFPQESFKGNNLERYILPSESG